VVLGITRNVHNSPQEAMLRLGDDAGDAFTAAEQALDDQLVIEV
jgi:hypothetical protein